MISSARSRVARAGRVGGVGERVEVQRPGQERRAGQRERAAERRRQPAADGCASAPAPAPIAAPTSGK